MTGRSLKRRSGNSRLQHLRSYGGCATVPVSRSMTSREPRGSTRRVIDGDFPGDALSWLPGTAGMSLDVYLEIPEHVLFRDLEGEVVLLNLETGCYFSLDEVGTRIWTLVEEGKNLLAIKETLHAEYSVEEADLERDLLELVAELKERGLVRETNSSSAQPGSHT